MASVGHEYGMDSPRRSGDDGMEDYYRPGGLFEEFLSLQPAQLSWGGVVSVLGSLVRSHKSALQRLDGIERGVMELRQQQQGAFGSPPTDVMRQVESAVESRVQAASDQMLQAQGRLEHVLDTKIQRARDDHARLLRLLQLEQGAMDDALARSASEGEHSHARVKLLHTLPAFATLIDDIREVLAPFGAAPPPEPAHPAHSGAYGTPSSRQHVAAASGSPVKSTAGPPAAGGRPMVGLEIIDAVPHSNDPLASSGVRVFSVRPEGPAAAAGIRDGDCILALNGRPCTTRQDLKDTMSLCQAGDVVMADLLRDGHPEPFQLPILLGAATGAGTPRAAAAHRAELSPHLRAARGRSR
eukprot:TRINITY_DN4887_c0_g2_i1.p1 TRINITY_DN4887_c0_g2~~TRINITY_DN4887_c0_g2_i1.p1  ORF type:complete len:395 (+),score=120.52 TRINITY_DN4887_c0_g2_i1:123-1187(+)